MKDPYASYRVRWAVRSERRHACISCGNADAVGTAPGGAAVRVYEPLSAKNSCVMFYSCCADWVCFYLTGNKRCLLGCSPTFFLNRLSANCNCHEERGS